MARQSLTLPEVAEKLGVHYMTAYRYVRTGRLPAKRSGSTGGSTRRTSRACDGPKAVTGSAA